MTLLIDLDNSGWVKITIIGLSHYSISWRGGHSELLHSTYWCSYHMTSCFDKCPLAERIRFLHMNSEYFSSRKIHSLFSKIFYRYTEFPCRSSRVVLYSVPYYQNSFLLILLFFTVIAYPGYLSWSNYYSCVIYYTISCVSIQSGLFYWNRFPITYVIIIIIITIITITVIIIIITVISELDRLYQYLPVLSELWSVISEMVGYIRHYTKIL